MNLKPQFNYYYGNEADQYTFYKIPKLLITHEAFRQLSNDSKILYGLLLDRMSLSVKNKWFDDQNRAYIVCGIEEIADLLNCSRNKAIKTLQELDSENGIGLVEKKRIGQGRNTIMYVKNFMIGQTKKSQHPKSETDSEVQNMDFQKSQKSTSKSPKYGLPEVQNLDPNKNKYNKNDDNETLSNPIVSTERDDTDDKRSDSDEIKMHGYAQIIKKNIAYDDLCIAYPTATATIEGIYELILETVLCTGETVLIASNKYPAELVRGKFLKLTYDHIVYALDVLGNNTSKVRNIKKYLLATLFNAPSTMDSYYQAEVNHDNPQWTPKMYSQLKKEVG